MAVVVITGSTKGIGRSLAEQFLRRGHNVAICGRDPEGVAKVVKELNAISPGGVVGQACDTTDKAQVQALWDCAAKAFGKVDYWINNAGRAVGRHKVHELPEDLIRVMVNSNLIGSIFGCQVAMNGFLKQGNGHLYNVLGGSFQGKRLTPEMGVYSSTKSALHRLTDYLIDENKEHKEIIIGEISPGMLITENWFDEQSHLTPEEWKKVRSILNVLCDHVDDVTPWLADQVLANEKSGKRIAWLTGGKIMKRFFDAKVLGRKRDLFSVYDL
jgi:NADP-dependent 3-hydroxy acid dehydrogenase YdfG